MSTVDDVPVQVADRIWVDPVSGCWVWGGSANTWQYPMVKWRDGASARRLVWSLTMFRLPHGWYMGRLCDTKRCVNPNHLTAGKGHAAKVAATQYRCFRRAARSAA